MKGVKRFDYLGENIQKNGIEKAAANDRITIMEEANRLIKNIYN